MRGTAPAAPAPRRRISCKTHDGALALVAIAPKAKGKAKGKAKASAKGKAHAAPKAAGGGRPPYDGPPLRPSLAHILNGERLDKTATIGAFCTAGHAAASKVATNKGLDADTIAAAGREGWRLAREFWIANKV